MRGRVLIAGLTLIPLAIASVVWSVMRPRPRQLHPGTISIVLTNERGRHPVDAQVTIPSATPLPGGPFRFAVDAGIHHVLASPEPPPGFNDMPPYSGGAFDLIVTGSPVDEVQVVEVRIGDPDFNAPGVRQSIVMSGPRTIWVIVHWPDGGTARDAVVTSGDQTNKTDDLGMTRLLAIDGTSPIFAGKDGLGGQATIANGSSTCFVDLTQRRMQLEIDVVGLDAPTRIALSSPGIRRDFSMRDGSHFSLPAIPVLRTSVCTGDSSKGACVVVVPDGGTAPITVVLDARPGGEVTFSPVVRGRPTDQPLVEIDGAERALTEQLALSPGQHILHISADTGEEYETLFTVEPGKRTDLGVLELK